MQRTIDDTMVYLSILTRHIHKDDLPAAILAVLAELEFQAHQEGFGHLRKSIFLRTTQPDLHLTAIYLEIIQLCNFKLGSTQIDQAIRGSISSAWTNRDGEKWGYFFSERQIKKPSNFEFIARIACFMELWQSWSKEVSCAGK